MRIAMLAPIARRTPPHKYGPIEQITSSLTEGLLREGVDITLFATADSRTRAPLSAVSPRGYEENPALDPAVYECLHFGALFERAGEFDLIHNQCGFWPLSYGKLVSTPLLSTVYGFPGGMALPVYQKYNSPSYYVAPSHGNKCPGLNYIAIISPGVAPQMFTFREAPGDYLLFYGEIRPGGGAEEALRIARRSEMKLVMTGVIRDREYYKKEVAPRLDKDKIIFLESSGPAERDRLLGGARALLNLAEPAGDTGLCAIEAMACGTPVIAFPGGILSDIVRHRENGFLVSHMEEIAEVLPAVKELDRRKCRLNVEERFNCRRMVREYLGVYRRIIAAESREDHRPWGHYEVLSEAEGYKVKRIAVLPHKRLSLQMHRRRSEHWTVVAGSALVSVGEQEVLLKPGETVDIPSQAKHRVENPGPDTLVFIEIQRGDYLGEDDIIRLQDDFGRR